MPNTLFCAGSSKYGAIRIIFFNGSSVKLILSSAILIQCHLLNPSFSYRIVRHQYKHLSYILFYATALSILQLIVLIALLFVFLCITDYLYLIYENVNDLNKLLMQLFMMIFVFALLKYLQKHF